MKTTTILLGLMAGFGVCNPTPVSYDLEDRGVVSTGPQCSYISNKPSGAKVVCGGFGRLQAPAPLGTPVPVNSANACRGACFRTGACLSFSFNSVKQSCQLYKKFIIKQEYKKATTGNTVYYNRKCFKKKCDITVPKACNNEGVQWAVYTNTFGTNTDKTYSKFDPTAFKTKAPLYQNKTTSIGGFYNNQTTISLYGSPSRSGYNYALNHRGYFFPLVSGPYTFSFSKVDDIIELWLGSKAYSGWNRTNEDYENSFFTVPAGNGGGFGSVSLTMTAGEYYPMRLMMAQGNGPSSFNLTIFDPNQKAVAGYGIVPNGQIMQYSCDAAKAPAYPAFGQET